MEVACPGDTIAVLPDDGVVKVDRSIVRADQELRCIQPGIRIVGDRQYRVQTNCKRYNQVVEQDRLLGVVTGGVLHLSAAHVYALASRKGSSYVTFLSK